jgi:hypothetical protein
MYQIKVMLPSSGKTKEFLLNMDQRQRKLYAVVLKNSQGVPLAKTGKRVSFTPGKSGERRPLLFAM